MATRPRWCPLIGYVEPGRRIGVWPRVTDPRRVQTVDRLQALLAEVLPGHAKATSPPVKTIVLARGSHLMDLHGVGPVVAARV